MKEQIKIQCVLQEQLAELKGRNPSYSLRAFAKKLGTAPSALSEILQGKRRVSRQMAEKFARNMGLNPTERMQLLKDFPKALKRNSVHRSPRQTELKSMKLNAEQFNLISDWAHYAILSLFNTPDFKVDPEWMGQRLTLTPARVRKCLERLLELGLIQKELDGNYKRSTFGLNTTDDVASIAIQKSHMADMEIAKEKLSSIEVEQRDFTACTFSFDPSKMPEVKNLIRRFQDELDELMKDGERTEVYRMCNYLFPLTKLTKHNEGRTS